MRFHTRAIALLAWMGAVVFLTVVLTTDQATAQSSKESETTYDGALTIAVHLSQSRPDRPPNEEVLAIRDFIDARVRELNAKGGIKGRDVSIRYFDDQLTVERTIENVDQTLDDPSVIAILGIWSSTRGAKIVDKIGASEIPFISEMSVETLFSNYPNIYTLTRSVRDEKDLLAAFAGDTFKRIAVVGRGDDQYTRTYYEHLKNLGTGFEIVSTYWHEDEEEERDAKVAAAIAEITEVKPDLLFLSIGSTPGARFLGEMTKAGLSPPVFVALGSANGVRNRAGGEDYNGPVFDHAEGGFANLNNERLEQMMRGPGMAEIASKYAPASLLRRRLAWLREHPDNDEFSRDTLSANDLAPESRDAMGYGARYSDLIELLVEAANKSPWWSPKNIRRTIANELAELKEGERIWRGRAQDWSFTPERASAERTLLVWRPPGPKQKRTILSPTQYVRQAGRIVALPVLYVNLDMKRIYQVDSSDKSFEAEFFFSLTSVTPIPIEAIEFTNAYRSTQSAKPAIRITRVHTERTGDWLSANRRIYHVVGRFTFEPDLRRYPFDQQVFSISFRPAETQRGFFLQPPPQTRADGGATPENLRNADLDVDGWQIVNSYVGTNELIIKTVAGPLSRPRVIPFYNFNYTWVMERQVLDYMLRVVVPLSFILIVTYLAVFIPRSDFEATIAIQVTALLSAIALYLALNQPSADNATLSDQIFVLAYATISVMIALSICEVNTRMAKSNMVLTIVHALQVYLVPLGALGALVLVLSEASAPAGSTGLMQGLWDALAGSARQVVR